MVVNKVIKTPLGSVELGMLCGKIVWCGFASVVSGASDAVGDAGTSGAAGASEADRAQKGIQMCPEAEKSASREQKGTKMCPEEADGIPEYSLEELLWGRGSIFRWEDLQLQGTPLQMRVWRELFNLLPRELITYSELAARCGYPKAVRAVATAVGKNPVSLIIPCHRVVRKSGNQAGGHKTGNQAGGHKTGNQAEKRKSCSRKSAISAEAWELGNYRWGRELKKRILEWEGII